MTTSDADQFSADFDRFLVHPVDKIYEWSKCLKTSLMLNSIQDSWSVWFYSNTRSHSQWKKVYFVAMDCSTWFAMLILKQAFLVLQLLAALWSSVWVPSYEMQHFLHTDCDRLFKDNVQKTHFNQHVRVTDWSWSSQYWNWHKSEVENSKNLCIKHLIHFIFISYEIIVFHWIIRRQHLIF